MAKASGELTQDLRGMPADLSMLYDPCPGIKRASAHFAVGAGGLAGNARVFGWVDKTDWKKRGRKSPKGVYQIEAQRRLEAGEVAPGISHKAFANNLRAWFIVTYPNKKPPAGLTIERRTRNLWHHFRS